MATKHLENAKLDIDNTHAIWIEEDYCSPPLAMEREAVLYKYFDNIKVEIAPTEEEGGNRIKDNHFGNKIFQNLY